jgi:hypothetical protein
VAGEALQNVALAGVEEQTRRPGAHALASSLVQSKMLRHSQAAAANDSSSELSMCSGSKDGSMRATLRHPEPSSQVPIARIVSILEWLQFFH